MRWLLIQTSKLKNLIPGITTAEELKTVDELIGSDCKIQQSGRCKFDENWDVSIAQVDSRNGNLFTISFYPRKRISFSKVRFSKQFSKSGTVIVHLTEINAENFISYSDKYGLKYVIVNESTDKHYKKGDLFYIEYGIPEALSK